MTFRCSRGLARLAAVASMNGLLLAVVVAAGAPKPIVTLTRPVIWSDINSHRIKGRPARLAWSDDRSTLYLQAAEGNTRETLTLHHFIVRKGEAPISVDAQPKWVDAYWKWKSAKSLAGEARLKIEVDTRTEVLDNLNGIAATKGIFLTDSLTGISGAELMLAKQPAGTRIVTRLLLQGHVIGEFVDEMIVPGYTFSWSPEDLRLMAYRAPSGQLTIMDDDGRTETVRETKDVLLPAWSDDGAAIAYLERTHGGRFSLQVVEVASR